MKKWLVYHVVSYVVAIIGLMLVLQMAGCSKKATKVEPSFEPVVEAPEPAPEPEPEPVDEGIVIDYKPAEPHYVTVYFDFDSDKLKPGEVMKLDALLNGGEIEKISGHACVIGTSEYNFGLGLARAERVREYIGRGETNSYGEEACRAACVSIDEAECRDCRKVEVWAR